MEFVQRPAKKTWMVGVKFTRIGLRHLSQFRLDIGRDSQARLVVGIPYSFAIALCVDMNPNSKLDFQPLHVRRIEFHQKPEARVDSCPPTPVRGNIDCRGGGGHPSRRVRKYLDSPAYL